MMNSNIIYIPNQVGDILIINKYTSLNNRMQRYFRQNNIII